jgi:hypothetical protein
MPRRPPVRRLLVLAVACALSGPAWSQPIFSCKPGAEGPALAVMKANSPDPKADEAAADAAVRQAQELSAKALAGEVVEAPYKGVAHRGRLAAAAQTPRTAELFRRAARDQLFRTHAVAAAAGAAWTAGLSQPALGYAYQRVVLPDCGVDRDNTAWLKAELDANGWFTLSRDGADAEKAAFLLVQHADQNFEFQRDTLRRLEPLAAAGEVSGRSVAFLHDRLAVADGRPQRYGTQGRCTGAGRWEPFQTEAPDGLDQRRAQIDQPPIAQYAASMARHCSVR